MIILGIDCASISSCVGVLNTECEPQILATEFKNDGLTHSQTLLPMIEKALGKANITAKDVDLIVLTKGPGSFTGLRIGMATAKGLAAPFGTPVVCVSTLEAIASTANLKHQGVLCAVMDARCNQVYNAIFKSQDGGFVRMCDDRAIAIADLEKELLKLDEPITLCGDGAKVCINNFEELRVDVAEQDVCLPQGDALCCLGLTSKNEATCPENISPAYLRLPQASRELLKKKKEN